MWHLLSMLSLKDSISFFITKILFTHSSTHQISFFCVAKKLTVWDPVQTYLILLKLDSTYLNSLKPDQTNLISLKSVPRPSPSSHSAEHCFATFLLSLNERCITRTLDLRILALVFYHCETGAQLIQLNIHIMTQPKHNL